MTFFRTATAAALVISMAPFAYAQSAKMTPQEFATMAASSDMLEIQSSKMALEQSQNASVKDFAQMMINDHTKASKNLKDAASKDGVTVPAEMLPKQASEVQKLKGQKGAAFDGAYVKTQVAAHEEALKLMTTYAKNGEGATKAHAEKTAPVIKMHLEHVQKMNKKM